MGRGWDGRGAGDRMRNSAINQTGEDSHIVNVLSKSLVFSGKTRMMIRKSAKILSLC